MSQFGNRAFVQVFSGEQDTIRESDMFTSFQTHYHFRAVYHSVWHPQSKGSAERYIQTIRKTMFVPPKTISDIESYNRSLLYKKGMDDIYAPDKPRVNTLYFEDFRALYLLPKEKFDATTYKEVTADSYGRICAEEKHIYTTRPEYAGHKVQIGISAHYVNIYTHEGKILIRHKREFGPERTISRDYSTTIDLLMSRPAAW